MTIKIETKDASSLAPGAAAVIWVGLIAALSVGGSFAFACAAPLAAIGALAATKMDRGTGIALVLAAWLSNQAVGYGLLDYPQTADSFAWGGAIGLGAIVGFAVARTVASINMPKLLTLGSALLTAFAAYEAVLYGAGIFLGGSDEAFSAEVVGRILMINAVSFVGLLILHRAAVALSWLRTTEAPAQAAV